MSDARHIIVAGFTRGGTAWLRGLIGHHPDVHELTVEYRLLRRVNPRNVRDIRRFLDLAASFAGKACCVHKSPTDSTGLPPATGLWADPLYVFAIRDPRDVVCSHMRSTMPWASPLPTGLWQWIQVCWPMRAKSTRR